MVTQEERNAIAKGFAEQRMLAYLICYREDRSVALHIKSIGFPNGPELTQAIQARKEWSEASKRVKELEKEVCK